MFYKIKINKNTLKFLSIVKKPSKPEKDIMYLTEEDFMKLSPDAVENYPLSEEGVPLKRKRRT